MDRREVATAPGRRVSGSFVLGLSGGALCGVIVGAALMQARVDRPDAPRNRSFAEAGEDVVAESIFRALNIERPAYLELDSSEPTPASNTYRLYLQGCRGILVEFDPQKARRLRRERPGDVVIEVGADVEEVCRVLQDQFAKAPLDFVSLRNEDFTPEVLESWDWEQYRPKVLCVRTLVFGSDRHDQYLIELVRRKGYLIRGSTWVSTIFVDGRLFSYGTVD